uniref:Uncharacterized protein n=1 Tax=Timema cristinae TaxID=61476 RepID=A0A7R9CRE9_TIMCR|nr:unnamed protein product [Timema cristinae]
MFPHLHGEREQEQECGKQELIPDKSRMLTGRANSTLPVDTVAGGLMRLLALVLDNATEDVKDPKEELGSRVQDVIRVSRRKTACVHACSNFIGANMYPSSILKVRQKGARPASVRDRLYSALPPTPLPIARVSPPVLSVNGGERGGDRVGRPVVDALPENQTFTLLSRGPRPSRRLLMAGQTLHGYTGLQAVRQLLRPYSILCWAPGCEGTVCFDLLVFYAGLQAMSHGLQIKNLLKSLYNVTAADNKT